MDPNANLAEQRSLIAKFLAGKDTIHDVSRFVDLVEALDTWLSRGGALPKAWGGK